MLMMMMLMMMLMVMVLPWGHDLTGRNKCSTHRQNNSIYLEQAFVPTCLEVTTIVPFLF